MYIHQARNPKDPFTSFAELNEGTVHAIDVQKCVWPLHMQALDLEITTK